MLQHVIVERDLLPTPPLGIATFPLLGDLAPIGAGFLVERSTRRLILLQLAAIFEHGGRCAALCEKLRQQLGFGIADGRRQRVGFAAARGGREQDEREWNQSHGISNRSMHAALLAGIR